jgi:hypothetical protein
MPSIMTDNRRLPLFDQAAAQDPTARRHGGSSASVEAHKRILPAKRAALWVILKLYREAGPQGLTAKEVAHRLGKALHEISGRVTELHQWGFILKTPARRLSSIVLVHRYYRLPLRS